MVWNLKGTEQQNKIIEEALRKCDFPFELLLTSLKTEGKSAINVEWQDLTSRSISHVALESAARGHGNSDHGHSAHVLEGRERVLGLFYLPPHTRILLDIALTNNSTLAQEVFLSEAAHAVDYHYMTNAMRSTYWNAIHPPHEDLNQEITVTESGDLHHGHSWFDGPSGYGTWVGESWMEGFVKSFAPSIPVTIKLGHAVPNEAVPIIRASLLPAVAPPVLPVPVYTQEEMELAVALRRIMKTRWLYLKIPKYLRTASTNWLNSKKGL